MIIVKNSNIVSWDDYPDFICAVVMQTTKDLSTVNGLTMPEGEELIWLLDKSPEFNNGVWVFRNMLINCMGSVRIIGNFDNFPADLKELHFKPKPVVKIAQKKEIENV